MKTLIITALIMVFAAPAIGATYYGNDGYSRRVRIACENATMDRVGARKRVNVNRAKQCFYDTIKAQRQEALVDSSIELNRAITKRLNRNQRW